MAIKIKAEAQPIKQITGLGRRLVEREIAIDCSEFMDQLMIYDIVITTNLTVRLRKSDGTSEEVHYTVTNIYRDVKEPTVTCIFQVVQGDFEVVGSTSEGLFILKEEGGGEGGANRYPGKKNGLPCIK